MNDPGEGDLLRYPLVARQDQFPEHLRGEEGVGLEGHIVRGNEDIEVHLASTFRHHTNPVVIDVENLFDERALVVQGQGEALYPHAEHSGHNAEAGNEPGGILVLLPDKRLCVGIQMVAVGIRQFEQRKVRFRFDHPLAVVQATIDAFPLVSIDRRSQDEGDVVVIQKGRNRLSLIQGVLLGLQVEGLVLRPAPVH